MTFNDCEQQRSQFSVMNDIVGDKKGHNIVNDNFTHKPEGLWVNLSSIDAWSGSEWGGVSYFWTTTSVYGQDVLCDWKEVLLFEFVRCGDGLLHCFNKLELQTHVISESFLELFDLLGFVLLSDL